MDAGHKVISWPNQFSRALTAVAVAAILPFVLILQGCVTYIPVDEYTMARAAYEAAKDADSARYVSRIWFSAEQAYREGQKAFRDRRYSEARRQFILARELSEKAENGARLARHQSGEVLP